MIGLDRERRPARSDRFAPHFDWLRPDPVGVDLHTMNHAVALRPSNPGPAGVRVRCGRLRAALLWRLRRCRPWRWNLRLIAGLGRKLCVRSRRGYRRWRRRRWLVGGLGKKPLLGCLGPTPVEIKSALAAHAASSDERES